MTVGRENWDPFILPSLSVSVTDAPFETGYNLTSLYAPNTVYGVCFQIKSCLVCLRCVTPRGDGGFTNCCVQSHSTQSGVEAAPQICPASIFHLEVIKVSQRTLAVGRKRKKVCYVRKYVFEISVVPFETDDNFN